VYDSASAEFDNLGMMGKAKGMKAFATNLATLKKVPDMVKAEFEVLKKDLADFLALLAIFQKN